MFENLSSRLGTVLKKVRGHGTLNEKNIRDSLRQVRLSLLEADVHFKVVKDFLAVVEKRALGEEVMESLTPGQQFVKIVNEAFCELMGGVVEEPRLSGPAPVVVLLVGLQGSGKTTTAAKLALAYRERGRSPLLVPADPYRPAASEQLMTLGGSIGLPVFDPAGEKDAVALACRARARADEEGLDTLLVDTAGRLHVDEELMEELSRMKRELRPAEILLVADAMTGQDAVKIATRFDERLDISGVVLTKLDGDARGGAALSMRAVTGKPIKWAGIGEKLDALEPFHPDRMASRILGLGDVLTLIEKAEKAYEEKEALELAKKIRKDTFNLEDFRDQIRQIKKMGSMAEILEMIPGAGRLKQMKGLAAPDEGELVKVEAIINSMTPEERRNVKILNGSRRLRIARGSGTRVQDVNRLLRNYVQMKKMMKRFRGGKPGMLKGGMPPLPNGGRGGFLS